MTVSMTVFASVPSSVSRPSSPTPVILLADDGDDGRDGRLRLLSAVIVIGRSLADRSPKTMEIPTRRRLGAARRSRPESARGVLGQVFALAVNSPTISTSPVSSSWAVPVQIERLAVRERTAIATASASITVSSISARLLLYPLRNVPGSHRAPSHAVTHTAKSAMRGSRSSRVVGSWRRPWAIASRTLGRLRTIRAEVVDPAIATHHGRLVKTTGDGLLVEFSSIVDALHAATEIQASIAEHNALMPQNQRIEFRMGLNVGDIVVEDGDIFGDGVNVAARLEGLAEPGGIWASARVRGCRTRSLPSSLAE